MQTEDHAPICQDKSLLIQPWSILESMGTDYAGLVFIKLVLTQKQVHVFAFVHFAKAELTPRMWRRRLVYSAYVY